ncbi:MAG TPA: hypothetical protein VMV45_09885 [Casimicrobiaceae bacterium]|nr:hypothetical protein [Casimicrobiaceae bacterium]
MTSSELNTPLPNRLPRVGILLERMQAGLRAALRNAVAPRLPAAEEALAGLNRHLLRDIGAPCPMHRERLDADPRWTNLGRWS